MPPQILMLAFREREVATIVYSRGAATAKQLERDLSNNISNGAIRSMLTRLVGKGILRRVWGSRGRGQEYVYVPAITPDDVQQRALHDLSELYFDGSLAALAVTALEMAGVDRTDAQAAVGFPDAEGRVERHARLRA